MDARRRMKFQRIRAVARRLHRVTHFLGDPAGVGQENKSIYPLDATGPRQFPGCWPAAIRQMGIKRFIFA
jgi:hypothetical protein